MLEGNRNLIEKYLRKELDKNEDVAEKEPAPEQGGEPKLSRQQQEIVEELVASVQEGWKRRAAQEDAWKGEGPEEDPADLYGRDHEPQARAEPFPKSQLPHAFAVLGPAGSGKTTAVHKAVQKVVDVGGRALLTAPTGRLAATMREKFPHLEVDTLHGAFLLYKPVQQALEVMLPYDLIIVEEIGQVSKAHFERIMEQWEAADRLTLVFVGDFFQLPGVDPSNALDSWLWRSVAVRKHVLYTMQRCKCPILKQKLTLLRTAKPSRKQKSAILRGHKAPKWNRAGYMLNKEPCADDVYHIYQEHPETLFLTITRRACSMLNNMALEVLFRDVQPLNVVPSDPESNLDNYYEGRLVAEEPLHIPIFAGAKVMAGRAVAHLERQMGAPKASSKPKEKTENQNQSESPESQNESPHDPPEEKTSPHKTTRPITEGYPTRRAGYPQKKRQTTDKTTRTTTGITEDGIPPQKKTNHRQDHQDHDRGITEDRIPPEEKTNHRQDHQDHDRGITEDRIPPEETTNKTTRTTTEGLQAVGLGYCPSIGRSGVSLCGGLQGVAPRGI